MPCCATTASRSASAIISGTFSSFGLRQLIHQLFDAGEEFLFAARLVGEAQLERTLEAVFLRFSLNHLQDSLRIHLVLLLEQHVAAGGACIYFSDAERAGAQFQVGAAK